MTNRGLKRTLSRLTVSAAMALTTVSSSFQSHAAFDTNILFDALPLPDPGDYTKMWKIAALSGQVLKGSVGLIDERRSVRVGEKEYDSVVSLYINGTACTGTIVEIDGYETILPGSLTVTAAHCVEGADPDKIRISGDYLGSDGMIHEFALRGEQTWVHPFFSDYNLGISDEYVDSRADIAFIFSSATVPEEVLPAKFVTEDLEKFWRELDQPAENTGLGETENSDQYSGPPKFTVVGLSGDETGLTTHEFAQMVSFDRGSVITTTADIFQRASGGPVFETDGATAPLRLDEKHRPSVIAVNSGIQVPTNDNIDPEMATATVLDRIMLSSVPFLQEVGAGDDLCLQMAVVNTDDNTTLNRRYGPATDRETLVELEGKPSALQAGELVAVLADYKNHLRQQWALVKGENGRIGFVSKTYLQYMKPQCFKF